MKLYLTAAGVYAGTQVEAKADGKGWTPEEVPTDKQRLIDYLNKLKFFSDERTKAEQHDPACPQSGSDRWPCSCGTLLSPRACPPEPQQPSYSQLSASLEESWDKLPLAHKLHFAALAMEEAREALP